MKFWVLTISDSCFEGTSEDLSGPIALKYLSDTLGAKGLEAFRDAPKVLPDDVDIIRQTVQQICDIPSYTTDDDDDANKTSNPNKISLLITVGGTGFGVRDCTPEAVKPLIEKEASGLVHAMMHYSLDKCTPFAWLSRPVAGVRNGTLVITVPGGKKACVECLTPLVEHGLLHALQLIGGDTNKVHPTNATAAAGAAKDTDKGASVPSSCTCCTSAVVEDATGPTDTMAYTYDPSRVAVGDNAAKATAGAAHTDPSEGTEASALPPLASRPRQSQWPMVPMVDVLQIIEVQSRANASLVTTVVHGGVAEAVVPTIGSLTNRPPTIVSYKGDMMAAATAVEGTVLAAPIVSNLNLPPFRASIKDGYGVVSADGVGEYPVASAATAGSTFSTAFTLQSGQICRVSTGGPVPEGADAVIQVEDTTVIKASEDGEEELVVAINKAVKPNTDIRPIGCDVAIGQTVLAEGAQMGPAEVALWHTVGQPAITHYRKPIVTVMSTGNELSDVTPLPDGTIYDSNKGMLLSALRQTRGGSVSGSLVATAVDGGIVRDDFKETMAGIINGFKRGGGMDKATHPNVLMTTGGVSMGEKDHIKAALHAMGATIHFGRVNMKPGKPTTFATIPATSIYGADDEEAKGMPDRLFFGLPGNPVSAMVCYHVFVVPCLRALCGLSPRLPTLSVQLTHAVGLDRERPEYHRCRLERVFGGGAAAAASTKGTVVAPAECSGTVSMGANTLHIKATSTGLQASHRLLSMHTANGLLVLPTGDDGNNARVEAGSYVEAIVIGEVM